MSSVMHLWCFQFAFNPWKIIFNTCVNSRITICATHRTTVTYNSIDEPAKEKSIDDLIRAYMYSYHCPFGASIINGPPESP